MRVNTVASFLGGGLLLSVLLSTAIAFTLEGGTLPVAVSPTTVAGSGPTTTTTVLSPELSACRADALMVQSAVTVYDATSKVPLTQESGVTPGVPASYPYGRVARRLLAGGYLSKWPRSNKGYSISLSDRVAGDVIVFVPANSKIGTVFRDSRSNTACSQLAAGALS